MKACKVRIVYYDVMSAKYKYGHQILLSIDHIISVVQHSTMYTNKELYKEHMIDIKEPVYIVQTTIENAGYSLHVVSDYINSQWENAT